MLVEEMKRNKNGRFIKGEHYSSVTEFKKGQHWRSQKPYWKKDWLYNEYITKERSMSDIAKEFSIGENNIQFWIKKHNIPSRSIKEIRKIKYWGLKGKLNGMYGRCGRKNPHWKGGITPERQLLYSSSKWFEIVKLIWKRDKAKCQMCGISEKSMHIHHKIPFEHKKYRTKINNLILLCKKCHSYVHSNKNKGCDFIESV